MVLERELGPLQLRILGMLEDRGLTVGEVQERLAKTGHEVAYTTVMTVIARMYDKRSVKRQRSGKKYVYFPASNNASDRIFARIHRELFRNARLKPIANLVDTELTPAELRELRELINEKLGERGDD
jgi:predicted transcriptional regulator